MNENKPFVLLEPLFRRFCCCGTTACAGGHKRRPMMRSCREKSQRMVPVRGCAGQRWGAERSRGAAAVSRPGRQEHTSHQSPWPKVLTLQQQMLWAHTWPVTVWTQADSPGHGDPAVTALSLAGTVHVNPNPSEAGCAWGWRVVWGESSRFEIVWSGGVRVKGTSGYRELAVWQSARGELRARHQGQNRPQSSRTTEHPEQRKPKEKSVQCVG